MPQNLTDDKSTVVQLMAWCHQATSHYLSQCWPSFVPASLHDIIKPQWVKYRLISPISSRLTSLELKRAVIWLPQCQWSNPEEYRSNTWKYNHNKQIKQYNFPGVSDAALKDHMNPLRAINLLAPGGFDYTLKLVNFKLISTINILSIFCEIAIRWMPQHLTEHQSTLVQVMAWCHQATSHLPEPMLT